MEFSYRFTRPAMLDYYYEIIIEYDKDTADFMEFSPTDGYRTRYYKETDVWSENDYDDFGGYWTRGEDVVFDKIVTRDTAMNDHNRQYFAIVTEYSDTARKYVTSTFWEIAVKEAIDAFNNMLLNDADSEDICFIISDMNENYMCKYEEKIRGKFIKEGWSWAKSWSGKERDAWDKSVVEFKKSHGMFTVTGEIDKKLEEIKSAAEAMDDNMPDINTDLTPPMATDALAEIETDPCNFASDLKEACLKAVSKIFGVINPVEVYNYYSKMFKGNIQAAKTIARDAQSSATKLLIQPVEDQIQTTTEYFAQLDAEREEFLKEHSDDVALFDVCAYQPFNHIETYSYEETEETSYNGVTIDGINDLPPADAPFTRTTYKELEPGLIARGGSLRKDKPNQNVSNEIYQHIYEGLQNCWIPMRIGWENYCREKGWNPTWNITSGYRPDSASYGSAHGSGWAIDIQPAFKNLADKKEKVKILAAFLFEYCKANRNIKVDQILREYSGENSTWCHVGYRRPADRSQRGQYFADFDANGKKGSHTNAQYI